MRAALREADQQHHDDPGWQSGGRHEARPLQSRRLQRRLVLCVGDGRAGDQAEEQQRRQHRQGVGPGARAAVQGVATVGQPHVALSGEGNDAAEHGDPEEKDAGDLVCPGNGLVEHGPCNDPREQQDDLCQHRDAGRPFQHAPEPPDDPVGP